MKQLLKKISIVFTITLLTACGATLSSCRHNVSTMSNNSYTPAGMNKTSYSRSKMVRKNIKMKAPRTDKSRYNKRK